MALSDFRSAGKKRTATVGWYRGNLPDRLPPRQDDARPKSQRLEPGGIPGRVLKLRPLPVRATAARLARHRATLPFVVEDKDGEPRPRRSAMETFVGGQKGPSSTLAQHRAARKTGFVGEPVC